MTNTNAAAKTVAHAPTPPEPGARNMLAVQGRTIEKLQQQLAALLGQTAQLSAMLDLEREDSRRLRMELAFARESRVREEAAAPTNSEAAPVSTNGAVEAGRLVKRRPRQDMKYRQTSAS